MAEKLEVTSYVSAETGTTIKWHRFRDEDAEWGDWGTWETEEVLSTDETVLEYAKTIGQNLKHRITSDFSQEKMTAETFALYN